MLFLDFYWNHMIMFSGPGRQILAGTNTCVGFSEALFPCSCDSKPPVVDNVFYPSSLCPSMWSSWAGVIVVPSWSLLYRTHIWSRRDTHCHSRSLQTVWSKQTQQQPSPYCPRFSLAFWFCRPETVTSPLCLFNSRRPIPSSTRSHAEATTLFFPH